MPVAETIAGRGSLVHDHPYNIGPIGVIGSASANVLAGEADVVVAVGTRLQDFTTGSWSVFSPEARFVSVNAGRFDATKHRALSVVADARESVAELSAALGSWSADQGWMQRARDEYAHWNEMVEAATKPTNTNVPSYAQVVGVVNRVAEPSDLGLTAAGGFPGELCKNWQVKQPGTFDCEFGFSCMGYEISGAWGAKMADESRDVIAFIGDGSYLMMNSDIYSTVLTGHKLIVVLCDNGGFAVINRLQNFKGVPSFNNQIEDCRDRPAGGGRLRRPRRLDGRALAQGGRADGPRGRAALGEDDRPHHRHRGEDGRLCLDAGRRLVGRGRAGGEPARGGEQGARGPREGAREAAGWRLTPRRQKFMS